MCCYSKLTLICEIIWNYSRMRDFPISGQFLNNWKFNAANVLSTIHLNDLDEIKLISLHVHLHLSRKQSLWEIHCSDCTIFFRNNHKQLSFIIFLELRKISKFNNFQILTIDLKILTVVSNELSGFWVTIVTSIFVLSNARKQKNNKLYTYIIAVLSSFYN